MKNLGRQGTSTSVFCHGPRNATQNAPRSGGQSNVETSVLTLMLKPRFKAWCLFYRPRSDKRPCELCLIQSQILTFGSASEFFDHYATGFRLC